MAANTATRHPLGALGRMGFVVGMHLALLLVLARGFGVIPTAVIPQTTADFFDDPAVPEPPPPPIDFKGRIDSKISIAPPQPIPLDLTDDTVIDPPPGVISGDDEGTGGTAVANERWMPPIGVMTPPSRRRAATMYRVAVVACCRNDGRAGATAMVVKKSCLRIILSRVVRLLFVHLVTYRHTPQFS